MAIFISLLLLSRVSLASPTSNEFDACKKLAVKSLEACLSTNVISETAECWKRSKNSFKSCVKKVKKLHSPDARKKRMEAELKAREKLEENNKND